MLYVVSKEKLLLEIEASKRVNPIGIINWFSCIAHSNLTPPVVGIQIRIFGSTSKVDLGPIIPSSFVAWRTSVMA